MSDTDFSRLNAGLRAGTQEPRGEIGRELNAKLIGVPEEVSRETRALRKTVRLRGEVAAQNRDGSVRVQTARGTIDLRPREGGPQPQKGDQVEVQIPPSKNPKASPDQASVRIIKSQSEGAAPTRGSETPVRVEVRGEARGHAPNNARSDPAQTSPSGGLEVRAPVHPAANTQPTQGQTQGPAQSATSASPPLQGPPPAASPGGQALPPPAPSVSLETALPPQSLPPSPSLPIANTASVAASAPSVEISSKDSSGEAAPVVDKTQAALQSAPLSRPFTPSLSAAPQTPVTPALPNAPSILSEGALVRFLALSPQKLAALPAPQTLNQILNPTLQSPVLNPKTITDNQTSAQSNSNLTLTSPVNDSSQNTFFAASQSDAVIQTPAGAHSRAGTAEEHDFIRTSLPALPADAFIKSSITITPPPAENAAVLTSHVQSSPLSIKPPQSFDGLARLLPPASPAIPSGAPPAENPASSTANTIKITPETLILQGQRAESLSGTITQITPDNLPVVSVFFPQSGEEQLFALQLPLSGLTVGSTLEITPHTDGPLTANISSPVLSGVQVPLPALVAPGPWPVMEELQQSLARTLTTSAHATVSTLMPSPSQPAQMGPAMLFFIAAVRGGDLGSWLGDKALDALREGGKKGLISRLLQEGQSLNRIASEPSPQDWRILNLPMSWDGHMQKIALYYKHEHDHSDEQAGAPKGTRFVFDLSLDHMGTVQVDGLFRPVSEAGKRLDLVVRTQQHFAQSTQAEMRRTYARALRDTGVTGELSFQTQLESWVTIQPRARDGLGVDA